MISIGILLSVFIRKAVVSEKEMIISKIDLATVVMKILIDK